MRTKIVFNSNRGCFPEVRVLITFPRAHNGYIIYRKTTRGRRWTFFSALNKIERFAANDCAINNEKSHTKTNDFHYYSKYHDTQKTKNNNIIVNILPYWIKHFTIFFFFGRLGRFRLRLRFNRNPTVFRYRFHRLKLLLRRWRIANLYLHIRKTKYSFSVGTLVHAVVNLWRPRGSSCPPGDFRGVPRYRFAPTDSTNLWISWDKQRTRYVD